MPLVMNTGDLVRALRNARNLSQTELAELASLTQSRVARIECGSRPSSDEIKDLARALGVPRGALMGSPIELRARDPFSTVALTA